MTDQTMVERIKALGVREGATDPVAVIKDAFIVLATLIQSDEYCWCQTFPCECVKAGPWLPVEQGDAS